MLASKKFILAAALQMLSLSCHAIMSDTLFLTSNERGNGIYNISNNDAERTYIRAEMVKIDVKDGKLVKTELNKDNVLSWGIAVDPGKFILNPGEIVSVGVKSLCKGEGCDLDHDNIYQIRFMPSLASDDSTANKKAVSVRFSVAPYYVIPASPQKVDYTYDYDESKKTLTFHNTGNTYLKVKVDNCTKFDKKKTSCQAVYFVLAGLKKTISLPDSFISEHTIIKVANHDQSTQKQFGL